jgi:hypothetical protein
MRDPWETDEPVEEIPQVIPKTDVNINQPSSAPLDTPVALRQLQTETAKPIGEDSRFELRPNVFKPGNKPLGLFSFNRENLPQGIIWAEILGKPLSKRGRR